MPAVRRTKTKQSIAKLDTPSIGKMKMLQGKQQMHSYQSTLYDWIPRTSKHVQHGMPSDHEQLAWAIHVSIGCSLLHALTHLPISHPGSRLGH